jgi:hypothetical protein
MLTTVKFWVAPLSHPSFPFAISSAKSNMVEVTSVSRRRVHLQIRYSPIPDSVGGMASQKTGTFIEDARIVYPLI